MTQARIALSRDDTPDTTAVFGQARPLRLGTTDTLVLDLASLYADRDTAGFLLFLPDGRIPPPPDPATILRPLLRKGKRPYLIARPSG